MKDPTAATPLSMLVGKYNDFLKDIEVESESSDGEKDAEQDPPAVNRLSWDQFLRLHSTSFAQIINDNISQSDNIDDNISLSDNIHAGPHKTPKRSIANFPSTRPDQPLLNNKSNAFPPDQKGNKIGEESRQILPFDTRGAILSAGGETEEEKEPPEGGSREEECSLAGITNPHDTDILFGSGGSVFEHPGNDTCQQLVKMNIGLYGSSSETKKLEISQSIVAVLREENRRFLAEDSAKKGCWFDIGDEMAIRKITQGLECGQTELEQETGGWSTVISALKEQHFGVNGTAIPKQQCGRYKGNAERIQENNLETKQQMAMMAEPLDRNGAKQQATLVIRSDDVLCGRHTNHSGNHRFRDIIFQSIGEYSAAFSQWEKRAVVARIASVFKNSGGRFLNQKKGTEDQWCELLPIEACAKVRQALEDAIRRTSTSIQDNTWKTQRQPTMEEFPIRPGLQELIRHPRDTDVLSGRGGAALRHPGNVTYRHLVNLNKGLYTTCFMAEKLKISRSIVAAIREQNGRFLEKEAATDSWFDIGDKKAIEKTSQALREGQPKLKKIIGWGAADKTAPGQQSQPATAWEPNSTWAPPPPQHWPMAHPYNTQHQNPMPRPSSQLGPYMAALQECPSPPFHTTPRTTSVKAAANRGNSNLDMTNITNPLDTDVLCGRGGAALNHPGNVIYRNLVNQKKGLYTTCLKSEKLVISLTIVATIRKRNGRFLEKDAANDSWSDIGDKKALEKTSQALREGQGRLRQGIDDTWTPPPPPNWPVAHPYYTQHYNEIPRPPGRCLMRNSVANKWQNVADDIAKNKVSGALRYGVSEAKEKDQQVSKEKEHTETPSNIDTADSSSPASSQHASPAGGSRSHSNSPGPAPSPDAVSEWSAQATESMKNADEQETKDASRCAHKRRLLQQQQGESKETRERTQHEVIDLTLTEEEGP